MDKRLQYNPNVDLSNYNPPVNNYQEPMNNYNPAPISNSLGASNIQMQQPMQPMQQQLPNIHQMHQQIPPHHMSQQYMIPENSKIEKMTSTKNKKNKKSIIKEICSMSTLRKIIIITILYIIISHNKTSLLLCNKVPYVCITNALSYNIVKGIIMALILIIFWALM